MKKILLAFALALCGLTLWLARERTNGARSTRVDAEAPQGETAAGARPDSAAELAPPPPPPEVSEGRRAPPSKGVSTSAEKTSVLVLRAVDGRAVEGAQVSYVDTADLLPEEAAELDPDQPLGTHSLGFRTDGRGRVNVPCPRDVAWVTASQDGLFGFVEIPSGATSARLELRPDARIQVRLLRHDGNPAAGVTIVLRQEGGLEVRPLSRAESDARGNAWLTHPLHFPGELDPEIGFSVLASLPIVPAVKTAWDPRRTTDEALELRLPPVGSVEVRVVGPDGALLREETEVFLFAASPHGEETAGTSVRTSNGTALFSLVGLGLELNVTAIPLEGTQPGVAVEPGPRSEGERVTLEIEAEGAFAVLTGRLLDPAGTPLAETRFEFTATSGSSGIKRTDGLGRFEIGATAETSTLELRAVPRSGEPLAATLALGRLARGRKDLGDVQLDLAPD